MTLWDASMDAFLAEARADAESRMQSRATVRRKTGYPAQDENTGREVPEWAVVYADLPTRTDGGSTGGGGSTRVEIGGVVYEQATGAQHFPADTHDLADDDLIEITSGETVGSVLRIVKAIKADQKTARRVPVVGVKRPKEWS